MSFGCVPPASPPSGHRGRSGGRGVGVERRFPGKCVFSPSGWCFWDFCPFLFQTEGAVPGRARLISARCARPEEMGLLSCANYPARNGGKKSSLKLHLRKAALRVVWPRKRTGKAWKSPFPPAPCALGLGDAVGHQRGRSQWGQLRPHSPDTASGIIPWSATSGKGSIALENLGGSCPLP